MAIKRYIADADNTITNAFKSNLVTRGTGSNQGESPRLEVFSLLSQASTSSALDSTGEEKRRERSRVLVKFPVSNISSDRTNKVIPASGSISWVLRLYNSKHTATLPDNFNLEVRSVTSEWEEGFGIDSDEYKDLTHNSVGSNWVKRAAATSWSAAGGDTRPELAATASFVSGTEDLSVDISHIVEKWINGDYSNYGLRIRLKDSEESGTSRSYYTKQFYSRHTDDEMMRPHLEARWDSSLKDDTRNFYQSSSLAPAADNLNTLYLYNRIRGQLVDIGALGANQSASTKLRLKVYATLGGNPKLHPIGGGVTAAGHSYITASWVEKGVYSATLAYTGSETTIYDVWATSAGVELFTGSAITVNTFAADEVNKQIRYVTAVTNLKQSYTQDETARFRLFIRDENWSPTIYTKATADIDSLIIPQAWYKVTRAVDDFKVIPYGTGSSNHTKLSYDLSGSYFDFDMSTLQRGYQYNLKFIYKIDGDYKEQPESFKFRID